MKLIFFPVLQTVSVILPRTTQQEYQAGIAPKPTCQVALPQLSTVIFTNGGRGNQVFPSQRGSEGNVE